MYFKTLRCIIPAFILLMMGLTGCFQATETVEPVSATIIESPITIAYPQTPVELSLISELPGMIRLIGDSSSDFVTGTVKVSSEDWVPQIESEYSKVTLVQKTQATITNSQDLTNLWKLRVSDSEPFQLEIHNSQAEGHWNFSGLPITSLYAKLGTAKNAFTFDDVNPTVMQSCVFHCGTGEVITEGILNAACRSMVIVADHGNLTLRFGGKEILENLQVSIQASTGTINISVSPEIATRLTITGNGQVIQGEGIIKLDSEGSNNIYETPSYQETQGKTIEIIISSGSGIIYLNPPP